MSTDNPSDKPNPQGQPNQGPVSMEFRHNPVSARVPERVAKGVMSTGVLVLDSPNEFILDFMQGLTRPFHVAARVVLTPPIMDQFVHALRDNLHKYEQRFGPPPQVPRPPQDRRPTLQEIYDEFKVPEELLSGTYANAVMVGHSPSEFFLDFITNFFPTSAVSCRVYMSVAQLPRVLEATNMALSRFQQRMIQARQAHQQGQGPMPPGLIAPPGTTPPPGTAPPPEAPPQAPPQGPRPTEPPPPQTPETPPGA